MRCTACNRPILTTPAATIKTQGSSLIYGPVCANRMGLLQVAKRINSAAIKHRHKTRQTLDKTQFDLFKFNPSEDE